MMIVITSLLTRSFLKEPTLNAEPQSASCAWMASTRLASTRLGGHSPACTIHNRVHRVGLPRTVGGEVVHMVC